MENPRVQKNSGFRIGGTMNNHPKVKTVKPLPDKRLLVTFQNSAQKIYNCTILLEDINFAPLRDDIIFNSVRTDQGGYGISWNNEIDLSESELWINGSSPE